MVLDEKASVTQEVWCETHGENSRRFTLKRLNLAPSHDGAGVYNGITETGNDRGHADRRRQAKLQGRRGVGWRQILERVAWFVSWI